MFKEAWRSGAVVLAVTLLTVSAAPASEGKSDVPNFLGPWLSGNNFKLIPAPEGPKPIDDLAGYIHHERGVDANGNDFSTNAYIGDYKNSLLTAWGAEKMKPLAED